MKHKHLDYILSPAGMSTKAKAFSAFSLVILADFLFYGHAMGWTAGLFGIVLVAIFALHNMTFIKSRMGVVITFLTLGQCILQIEKQSLLSFLLMVLGLISLSLMKRDDWKSDAFTWVKLCLSFCLRFMRPLNRFTMAYQRILSQYTTSSVILTAIRGWFLPLIFSLVFLYLFSNANPIMMNWFDGIDLFWLFSGLSAWRVAFWLIMTSITFAIIRPRLKSRVKCAKSPIYYKKEKSMGFMEWAFSKDAVFRSLIIFNLMFAFQTVMDMNYLWAGSALPEGISYAKYAHKGAYPLIVTALLAGLFVLITQGSKKEVSASKSIIQLTYLWISQNVLLVLSSIYRTSLYVEIYALTYWRVAAFIWMGLVAFGLIWIIARGFMGKSNTWLINANVITLLTVLYVTSFVNIGGVIAHYNIEHSREVSGKGVNLDTRYLERIGYTSIPYLIEFSKEHKIHDRILYIESEEEKYDTITEMKLELMRDMDDWRRWTYSEYRLIKTIESKQK
ncbi:MAG: DUF4153 domain-containing protein [Alphaproteobacteria bacterium]